MDQGSMHEEILQATIVTIPKPGKPPITPANFRPISLLNSDLKIYAKILAYRLLEVLPTVIHNDQVGFTKGRSATDGTRKIQNLMDQITSSRMSSLLLSLDAEKAFDRVHWGFAFEVLRRFGVGEGFLRAVQALYTKPSAKVLVDGVLSSSFYISNGKPFSNFTSLNAAVTNIIVALLLNKRFDYEDPTILRLMGLVCENIKLLGCPWVRLYNSFPSIMNWLPGPHRTFFKNLREFQNFITVTFTKYKKEVDVNEQRNFVDAFLAKQQEGKQESTQYYHNENLTALMADLFGAGMETTSTTLRWGLLLMTKYPEIQKKVQNEIDKVIGSAQPQMEDRKQMAYTDAVIQEIQRFGDIASSTVPHVASQDVTFRGYFIPKGTPIIPVLHSIHRDKEYFQKPNEFYPEHFLDSEGNFKKIEAFIPFSIGRRRCTGESLAKMELFLFFTSLLQQLTFKAQSAAELDLTPALGSLNSPKPFAICAIPRS
ncbi:cytochrome P450 2C15-like [Eleutherodactylus coqui]|uniref:cytochrome P450 2C15-like n=1 Tax=Eleutherodactylus coqui TaxID=57060 RepID=UPI0034634BA5